MLERHRPLFGALGFYGWSAAKPIVRSHVKRLEHTQSRHLRFPASAEDGINPGFPDYLPNSNGQISIRNQVENKVLAGDFLDAPHEF
jgi:hypothetical protein